MVGSGKRCFDGTPDLEHERHNDGDKRNNIYLSTRLLVWPFISSPTSSGGASVIRRLSKNVQEFSLVRKRPKTVVF